MLKQGLQAGISKPRSRWESPKVQRTVSGSREGRSRMKMRQGSRMREEVSIVALSRDCSNLLLAFPTEGAKRERAKEPKLRSNFSS